MTRCDAQTQAATQSTWERTCSHVMRRSGCKPGHTRHMTPLAKFDCELGKIIGELTLRIVTPRRSEFESVWEVANSVCDWYHIQKTA
jgi:hypothetical protein